MNIRPILNAFSSLHNRGVKDPIYARLIIRSIRCVGYLWRDPKYCNRPLQTGESFVLSLRESTDVTITWLPMFRAKMTGTTEAIHYVCWFLDQHPEIAGGTHCSIDSFERGAADWERPANDFYMVRCGMYRCHDGSYGWRWPSEMAFDWVKNPKRFITSENIRKRVLIIMSQPYRPGSDERTTIRRLFDAELEEKLGYRKKRVRTSQEECMVV